jgi:hypothetical protein
MRQRPYDNAKSSCCLEETKMVLFLYLHVVLSGPVWPNDEEIKLIKLDTSDNNEISLKFRCSSLFSKEVTKTTKVNLQFLPRLSPRIMKINSLQASNIFFYCGTNLIDNVLVLHI